MTQRNVQQGLRPAPKPGRSKPCPLNGENMPKFLTTHELAEATAGGDSYIRTRNNEEKGLAN